MAKVTIIINSALIGQEFIQRHGRKIGCFNIDVDEQWMGTCSGDAFGRCDKCIRNCDNGISGAIPISDECQPKFICSISDPNNFLNA